MSPTVITKRCRGFNRDPHVELASAYAASRATSDGLQKLCRQCHATSMRAYRTRLKARTPEEVALRQSAGVKRCHRCSNMGRDPVRPLNDFHESVDSPDGKRNHCKDCVRELRWKHYGIVGMTVERFAELLEQQNYRCAIPSCNVRGTDERVLDVDHDHATGEVRGLLCRNCNTILGKSLESVAILADLIAYLRSR